MKKKKYVYYIAYGFQNGNGRVILTLNKPLDTSETVEEVTKYISENCHNGEGATVLLFWKELKR